MSEEQSQNPPQQPPEHGKITKIEKNLVVSFIQFLRQKVSANECSVDQIEALEVAIQCMEGAFEVSDKNYAFQPSKSLIEIFKQAEGLNGQEEEEFPTPTQVEIDQANKLKEEGNDLVKGGRFQDAIQKYNEAIQLNRDPIYFCNRAAAYCRLDQHDLAIQDCRTALALDPNYAKAYGRMGVALSCQNRYDQAVEAYKHALELDPNNESYKQNLSIAEDKLREVQEATGGQAGAPNANPFANLGGLGGLGGGLGGLFNPQMAEMAAQMMQDPNVQNMMSQMMGAFGGQGGQPGQEGAPAGGPGLENLLRVGEQIAETMQRSNPELVENLRRQFDATRGPSDPNNPNPNPDPNQPGQQ